MDKSLFAKVADGALWMVLFKVAERGMGLISTLILVRLLEPADFGIVAMAISSIALVEIFAAFGFDTALIRQKNATAEHFNTAWTFNVIFTGVVAMIMFAAAPWVAAYYQTPAVRDVIMVLAFAPLLVGIQNIGIVEFRKELNFKKEFRFQLAKKLFGFALTIPLAFVLGSYWALVYGNIGSRLFAVLISYLWHPFRPRLSMSRAAELMNFSKWMVLVNLVEFLKQQSATLVIGRILTPDKVGIFNVSYEVANLPTTEFGAPINRALLPGFAKSESSGPLALFRAAISTVAIVAIPAAFGIYSLAHLLVPVALGIKWLEAEPVIQILAFNGTLLLLQSSFWTILIAAGLPRVVFRINLFYVGVLLGLFVLLMPSLGLIGAASACVGTSIITMPVFLLAIRKHLKIPIREFFKALMRPALCAIVMSLTLWTVLPAMPTGSTILDATWLISGAVIGAISYAGLILVLWTALGRPDGGEQIIINRLNHEAATRMPRVHRWIATLLNRQNDPE